MLEKARLYDEMVKGSAPAELARRREKCLDLTTESGGADMESGHPLMMNEDHTLTIMQRLEAIETRVGDMQQRIIFVRLNSQLSVDSHPTVDLHFYIRRIRSTIYILNSFMFCFSMVHQIGITVDSKDESSSDKMTTVEQVAPVKVRQHIFFDNFMARHYPCVIFFQLENITSCLFTLKMMSLM